MVGKYAAKSCINILEMKVYFPRFPFWKITSFLDKYQFDGPIEHFNAFKRVSSKNLSAQLPLGVHLEDHSISRLSSW